MSQKTPSEAKGTVAMTTSGDIAHQIWDMKYRLKDAEGHAIDRTVEDTWRRIARSLSEVENDPLHWEDRFYKALEDFRFLRIHVA